MNGIFDCMGRTKKRPDLDPDKLGINPFTEGLEVLIRKQHERVLNKFGLEDIKVIDWEVVPYTKVFEVAGAKEQLYSLTIRGKELYLWLIHAVDSAQDYVWINRDLYMKQMGITSRSTFLGAIRSLSDNLYIYPHYRIKDLFWINPHYFFKGNRINKYREKVKVK